MSDQKTPKRYLTAAQVRERYGGVSHMWLERRLLGDPDFPRFIKFGRLRFWDESSLEAWERRQAAQAGKVRTNDVQV